MVEELKDIQRKLDLAHQTLSFVMARQISGQGRSG